MNRVATVQSQATSGTDCWSEQYTYDRYANLSQIGPYTTSAGGNGCQGENLSQVVSASNNRVSGFSYDNSGNVTYDGTYTYTWNAEGRMATAAVSGTTTTYSYDGMGRRVGKTGGSGKLYWYGPSGKVLAETDGSGNILSEYIYFTGQRIARRDPNVNGGANPQRDGPVR